MVLEMLQSFGRVLVVASTAITALIAIVAASLFILRLTRQFHAMVHDFIAWRGRLAAVMLVASVVLYCEVGRHHLTHLVVSDSVFVTVAFVVLPLLRHRNKPTIHTAAFPENPRNPILPHRTNAPMQEALLTSYGWERIKPVLVHFLDGGVVSASYPSADQWHFISAARGGTIVHRPPNPFVLRQRNLAAR